MRLTVIIVVDRASWSYLSGLNPAGMHINVISMRKHPEIGGKKGELMHIYAGSTKTRRVRTTNCCYDVKLGSLGGTFMALMGIDIGTSGAKVILVNEDGEVMVRVTEEYPSSSPKPQWSEQNPGDWWKFSCSAIRKALSDSTIKPDEITGIGLSGQMVGLVVLDERGEVIRPCIMWNDQRSAAEADELTQRIGRRKILQETSNPIFATFVAPKIVWMKNNEPELYGKICHVLLPKDYVAYRLTGEIATEVSDASGTCLFDVRNRGWSDEMIRQIGIPQEWLPTCRESDEETGRLSAEASGQTGLSQGTIVIAGGGDQAAQALGTGIVKAGLCSVTIGTSGVVFTQTDRHREHPEGVLHSFCHSVHDQWFLMGVMLSAGGSFQWFRNTLRGFSKTDSPDYDKLTALAAEAPPGCEGLVFLPYLTGERCPYDDPSARGGWIGLTQRHEIAHMTRAVMEGITFGLFDSLQAMSELGSPINTVYASGGAAQSPMWRQMLADVFDVEITRTNSTEGAAFGAAILAGIGTGVFSDAEQAADAMVRITDRVEPQRQLKNLYADTYGVYHSLYPQLKESFGRLTSLATQSENNQFKG